MRFDCLRRSMLPSLSRSPCLDAAEDVGFATVVLVNQNYGVAFDIIHPQKWASNLDRIVLSSMVFIIVN